LYCAATVKWQYILLFYRSEVKSDGYIGKLQIFSRHFKAIITGKQILPVQKFRYFYYNESLKR